MTTKRYQTLHWKDNPIDKIKELDARVATLERTILSDVNSYMTFQVPDNVTFLDQVTIEGDLIVEGSIGGTTDIAGKIIDANGGDAIEASRAATANMLLALDANGDFPLTAIKTHVRGSILRVGPADWQAHAAETDGAVLAGDGTDINSTLTPTWKGTHTWSGTNEINLRDATLKLYSSADGQVDLDADVEIELTAPTIDLRGNVDVLNGLDVTGNITVSGTVDGVDIASHATRHESGGADAVGHDYLTGFVADEHIAHSGVTLTAGVGLTGGGTIAVSRTFAVGAGSGITVNANDVALTWGTPTIGTIQCDDTANAGVDTNPTRSDHQHAIVCAAPDADSVNVAASAEGSAYSFARSNHTHNLDEAIAPIWTGAHTFQANIQLDSAVEISTDNWASGAAGWGIQYDGTADFRIMTADELHVKAFIADIYQSLIGGIVVTKSRARISRNFTIPADTASATLYVEDLESWENTQLFTADDVVRLRYIDSTGGGLVVADVWGVVTVYNDLVNGEQSYTFTTTDDGGVDGSVIFRGSYAFDYGQHGAESQGIWEATVLDAAGAPYSQVATWETNPWTPANWTTWVRLGNLDGIAGIDLEYGLWAGQGTGDADQWLLISNSNVELHNLDLEIHDGANAVIQLDHDDGLLVSSGAWGTDTTVFAAALSNNVTVPDLDQYDIVIGTPFHSTVTSRRGLHWDNSAGELKVYADLIIGPNIGFSVGEALMHCPFDGPRPFETDYQVNTTGHLGQQGTTTGGVIGRPGKFGKGAQVAEATVNLETNPSMELGDPPTGYDDFYSPTRSRTSDYAKFGTYSQKVIADAALDGVWDTISASAETDYTFSVWVRADVATSMALYCYDQGNNILGDVLGISVTTAWQKFAMTRTMGAGDTAIKCAIVAAEACTFYVDGYQVERKAYCTPTCIGDMGNGHSFSGAAHASTSSRTAAELNYDDFAADLVRPQMTVCGWWVIGTVGIGVYVFDTRGANDNNRLTVTKQADDKVDLYVNGAWRITDVGSGSLSPGDKIFWCGTFDFDADSYTLTIIEDNGTKYSGTDTTALTIPVVTVFSVGLGYWGGAQVNGVIDDLVILDRVLTADEIRAIYESNAPVVVSGSGFEIMLTGPGAGKVVGHSGGLFGWDSEGTECFALSTEDGLSWAGGTLNSGDVMFGSDDANMMFDANTGRINFRGGITIEAYVDTTGAIMAGGGSVMLDAAGLHTKVDDTVAGYGATGGLFFKNNDYTVTWGSIQVNRDYSASFSFNIKTHNVSGYDNSLLLEAECDSATGGTGALVRLYAHRGADVAYFDVFASSGSSYINCQSTDFRISDGSGATILGYYSSGDMRLKGGLYVGSISVDPSTGAIGFAERSSDPTEPAEGQAIIWMSNGSGKGDDGDIMIASKAGGTTKYGMLFDHSSGAAW